MLAAWMSPQHGLGQSEEAFWHHTPIEVAVRLEGLAMLMSGGKDSEAQENADRMMALAAASGSVETVKVTRIIKLDGASGR